MKKPTFSVIRNRFTNDPIVEKLQGIANLWVALVLGSAPLIMQVLGAGGSNTLVIIGIITAICIVVLVWYKQPTAIFVLLCTLCLLHLLTAQPDGTPDSVVVMEALLLAIALLLAAPKLIYISAAACFFVAAFWITQFNTQAQSLVAWYLATLLFILLVFMKKQVRQQTAVIESTLKAQSEHIRSLKLLGQMSKELSGSQEKLQKTQAKLNTDPLTGAESKHALQMLMASAQDHAEHGQHCILYLDLDGLKTVNDAYGHKCGDAYLTTAAKAATQVLRRQDRFFRIGGDEFVALLLNCPLQQAYATGRRINQEFLKTKTSQMAAGFSIGAAAYLSQTDSLEASLEKADHDMYENKRKRQLPVIR